MFKIENAKGVVNSDTMNWRVIDIDTSSVSYESSNVKVFGRYGSIPLGSTIGNREDVVITFNKNINDIDDYEQFKNEVQNTFYHDKLKLFIDSRPNEYLLLTPQSEIDFERRAKTKGYATVTLMTVGSPFFVGLNKHVIELSNTATMTIDSLSDVDLDTRYTDLKLTFTINQTAAFIELTFHDRVVRVDHDFVLGDELVFEKGTVKLNGTDIIEESNYEVPNLKPGSQSVRVRGATQFKAKFEFTSLKY